MNILFLHAGAEMYGADKVLLDLVIRLDKNKYKPYVILPEQGILVDSLREKGVEVDVVPYPIMRRKYFNVKGIINYLFSLMKYTRIIARYAREHNIQLVHTNTAATLEGCFVAKKIHVPQLWSIHEIIVSPKVMFKFTSWMIAHYAKVAITVSMAAKNHLEESGYFAKDSVKVIYNGVDTSRFKPEVNCDYLYNEWNIPRSARIIGMIGRVNSWKGQHDFLKAANIIMEKYDDVYTVFVGAAFQGEEWRETELADAIAESPYRDRIINQGYRLDSQNIFKMLDIFVLPSTNPDPLPTVVLENMAIGNPIVAYKHGGVCEMVKEGYNGLFAEVKNPVDLASKIEILLQDDSLRKEMGENSRKRLLESFSIDSYVDNYSREYDRLIMETGKE